MKVIINKTDKLNGLINIIGSKSYAHRMLIGAFLSNENCIINNVPNSNDIDATLSCLKELGLEYKIINNRCELFHVNKIIDFPILDAKESGSTLRFLIPLALYLTKKCKFIGSPRLIERGISIYEEIFNKQNIKITKGKDYIEFEGKLKPCNFEIDGSISSQFITGLLLVTPLMDEDSVIRIKPPINSENYIDITLDVLKMFNIKYVKNGNEIKVFKNQKYNSTQLEVEGDYSNAAFFDAFNYFNNNIQIIGLKEYSYQGDKAYIELFERLNKNYCEIDISNSIDLGPILFVFASLKNGAIFTGTNRLKIKESDRALSLKEELNKLGVDVEIGDDFVIINKIKDTNFKEISFNSHNDHRIAMALSLYSCICDIEIDGYECVNKSYPEYFIELEKLGAGVKYE